jgi:RecA/RadA recombinase
MAKKPFGKKFKKNIEKFGSPTIHMGLGGNLEWVSCGNYAMNKLLSGSYFNAFMFGRSVLIGGESGSGKSLVLATSAAEAQKEYGTHIIWIDVEEASTYEWMEALGVDISEDMFSPMHAATMEDVKKIIAEVVAESKAEEGEYEDKNKIMIVVDSWSDLMTEKEYKEATTGKMVGDQGQAAKQIKNVIKGAGHLIARSPIIVAGVVHTMESQDKYDPDEKFLGGRGLVYLASLAFLFTKHKLKAEHVKEFNADFEGDDKKNVGNRAKVKLYKTRFAKPNEEVEVQMVYPNGLDPFSGLFEYMREDGLVVTAKGLGRYTVDWPEGVTVPSDFPDSFTKKQFKDLAMSIMKAVDKTTMSEDAAQEIEEVVSDEV